jgi:hypothetical protein
MPRKRWRAGPAGLLSTLTALISFTARSIRAAAPGGQWQSSLEPARHDSGTGEPQRRIYVEPADEKKLS